MSTQLEAYVAELRVVPELPPFEPDIEDLDSAQDKNLRCTPPHSSALHPAGHAAACSLLGKTLLSKLRFLCGSGSLMTCSLARSRRPRLPQARAAPCLPQATWYAPGSCDAAAPECLCALRKP